VPGVYLVSRGAASQAETESPGTRYTRGPAAQGQTRQAGKPASRPAPAGRSPDRTRILAERPSRRAAWQRQRDKDQRGRFEQQQISFGLWSAASTASRPWGEASPRPRAGRAGVVCAWTRRLTDADEWNNSLFFPPLFLCHDLDEWNDLGRMKDRNELVCGWI